VPPVIAAVEAFATVGEVADTLRAVFGEYRDAGLDV
jgi:methylmalonyl-CoA mutase N-terminal domain/subunit